MSRVKKYKTKKQNKPHAYNYVQHVGSWNATPLFCNRDGFVGRRSHNSGETTRGNTQSVKHGH